MVIQVSYIGEGGGVSIPSAGWVGCAVFGCGQGVSLNLLGNSHPLCHPLDDTLPFDRLFSVIIRDSEVAFDEVMAGFKRVKLGEGFGSVVFECGGEVHMGDTD